MKVSINLNGETRVLDAAPAEPLLKVLRRERLFSVKDGCERGHCGHCMVLEEFMQDGKRMFKTLPSCSLPVSLARDNSIITMEYIQATDPLYKKILSGFTAAGIILCGYCSAGKVLTTYELLHRTPQPTEAHVRAAVDRLDCCCTDSTTLVNAILTIIKNNYVE